MAKNKKADNQVSAVRRAKHGWILTVFFSILAVLWLYPIFLVAVSYTHLDMDFCITIRTMIKKGREVYLQAVSYTHLGSLQ